MQPMECDQECHLPANVVALIAEKLVATSRQWQLPLLAMAGVSPQWREVVSQLSPDIVLQLDGLEPAQPLAREAALYRSRPLAEQQSFLQGCAALLKGYGKLVARGACINDCVLIKAARRSGDSWRSLRIEGAAEVSDRALLACGAQAPGLRELSLVGLPRVSVRGLTAFMSCSALESLELADLHALDGGERGGGTVPRQLLSVPNVLLVARLFQSLPRLTELKLAAPAAVLFAAIRFCPQLERLIYTADSPAAMHAVVAALPGLRRLTALSLTARCFAIPPETARIIGQLPLTSLRLDSAVYEAQCSAHRVALSHLDNDAVKALVDGVCQRWRQFSYPAGAGRQELQEFSLSLRGATGLAHDAVSTLLRLPVLTELDVSGCSRISAMDRMRLVAKVKAGCEILAGQARRAGRPPVASASDAVSTPSDHGAYFRGERQVFGSAASSSGAQDGGGAPAGRS